MKYRSVHFYESGYSVRSIECEEDRRRAYRLRHQVFCEDLKWTPPSPGGLEMDRYDSFATSLGLFWEESLLGFIRFLPPDRPFMLENDFSDLIGPGYQIRKEADTMEISRLTIAPSSKSRGLSSRYLSMLLKGLYQWSLLNEIRFSYLEVEKRFWRSLFSLGFPSTPIGPFKALPPAEVESVAAILDWEEFRRYNLARRPAFLDWMTTLQSDPVASPGRWRGRGWRPGASRGYYERESSPSFR